LQDVVRHATGVVLNDAQMNSTAGVLLQSGVDSWPKLLQLLSDRQGGVFDVLDARADAVAAFNATLAAAGKSDLFSGAAVTAAVGNLLQSIGVSADSIQGANAGLTTLAGRLTPEGIRSTVLDGYVRGATVFADANGNHRLDPGEWSALSDAAGGFVLPGGATGSIVASGGIDLLTNQPLRGVLTAPAGSVVVSPITTMVDAMVSGGATVEQATAKLALALNLPTGVSLLGDDPLAVLADPQAGAAQLQQALVAEKVNVKLAALIGSSAGAGSLGVIGALADALAQGAVVDLSDASVIRAILTTAAQASGSAADSTAIAALATIVAANNAGVDRASNVAQVAQAATAIAAAQAPAVPDPGPTDQTAPRLSITSSASALHPGQAATVTFTFSEDPGTSFVDSDISVSGGTLGALAGAGTVRTAVFTPGTATSLSTGADLSVAPSAFQDAAGNTGAGTPRLHIATASNAVLFVGNSATFARVDPVMSYDTYNAATNPGGVHDLTSPDRGGSFTNVTGSNLYEAHNWGGVPGLVDRFADQVGLNYDVSISARNAATLGGHYKNSSPAGWDLRGNIAGSDWDIVVLQDQTDHPLPSGHGSITFAAGSSSASLVVTPRADTAKEYDETLGLTLAPGTTYRVGTSASITGTLLNDDPTPPTLNPALPTVTLVANPGSVAEDGASNLVYTFTRSGATTSDLTVSFTAFRDGATSPSVSTTISASQDLEMYNSTSGALSTGGGSGTSPYRFSSGAGFATSGSTGVNTTTGSVSFTSNTGSIVIKAGQTSASLTIDPHADTAVEADESIKLTLTHPGSGADYNLGTGGAVTGTIVNDDFAAGTDTSLPNITLGLSSAPSVYEDAGQSLVYTFTRSGSTTAPLTVNFNEDGTATYFAGDAAHSDFGIATSGATGASLVTTSGSNAGFADVQTYANLIASYIHTGAADSTTIPGTTIAANPNADAATDIYLYATWARPDMVVGGYDMVTDSTPVTSGPNAGADTGTGASTRSDTQAAGYYLRLEDMSTDLTNAYNALAAANAQFLGVAPVSTAFMSAVQQGLAIRDPYTEGAGASVADGKINLWYDDNLHASKYGSYLAGLTLFETLTGLDARVLGADDAVARDLGIDASTAVALQKVASATLGLDAAVHWTAPGKVSDLGGTGQSAQLATAGAFSFVDPAQTQHTVRVQPQGTTLGTLSASVRSDGHAGQVDWAYQVDNQVLDPLLGAGQQRVENFSVALDDGHGHVSTQLLAVTLVGVA
jgi:hypothetical protein